MLIIQNLINKTVTKYNPKIGVYLITAFCIKQTVLLLWSTTFSWMC